MLSERLECIPYVDDCECIMLFDTSLTKRWIFYLNIFFSFLCFETCRFLCYRVEHLAVGTVNGGVVE